MLPHIIHPWIQRPCLNVTRVVHVWTCDICSTSPVLWAVKCVFTIHNCFTQRWNWFEMWKDTKPLKPLLKDLPSWLPTFFHLPWVGAEGFPHLKTCPILPSCQFSQKLNLKTILQKFWNEETSVEERFICCQLCQFGLGNHPKATQNHLQIFI